MVALDKYVECGCGWSCRGAEDHVVAECTAHGRDIHQMDLSREQVLAAAKPIEDADHRAP
jgi:predicted small metal-binding protein